MCSSDLLKGGQPAQRRPNAAPAGPHDVLLPSRRSGSPLVTWIRLGLGVAIGIGMTQWPYNYSCGLKLYVYLGGVVTVFVAGLWSSLSSWRHHQGFAHVVSQCLVILGVVLGALEVIPRIGSNSTENWTCTAPSAPAPPASSAPKR